MSELLTPKEQAPFVHTDLVDYGDTTVGEEVWDIEGLLKAQLAKAQPDRENTPDYLKMSHEANMRYGLPKIETKLEKSIDDLLWAKCLGDTVRIRNAIIALFEEEKE